MTKKYKWYVSVWKGVQPFVFLTAIAGLTALVQSPKFLEMLAQYWWGPTIVAFVLGVINWLKNRNK